MGLIPKEKRQGISRVEDRLANVAPAKRAQEGAGDPARTYASSPCLVKDRVTASWFSRRMSASDG
ncbi:hypothetical protein CWB41_02700 [Methylovirgula ligni]|nr:hypothetical protein CWB41_02700 [Methylovirgula ligni]